MLLGLQLENMNIFHCNSQVCFLPHGFVTPMLEVGYENIVTNTNDDDWFEKYFQNTFQSIKLSHLQLKLRVRRSLQFIFL